MNCAFISHFYPFKSINALNDYEKCLFIETHVCQFNLTLSEGTHYLIIDNTGYTAGLYFRGRPTATIQYAGVLPDSESSFQDRTVFGEHTLESQAYLIVNVTIIVNQGNSALCSFVVTSSNEVSIFLTNVTGMTAFQEGVASTDFRERPMNIDPWILAIVVILVIGTGLTMYFVLSRRQKQRESIYTLGETSSQFTSTHKAPTQQIGSMSTGKNSQINIRDTNNGLCPHCNTPLVVGQQYCSHCGKKA